MKRLITGALLGAAFALSGCGGGGEEAAQTETDAMGADTGTMTMPQETTPATDTGAAGTTVGEGMEPGAGMDPGGSADAGAGGAGGAGAGDAAGGGTPNP